MSRNWTNTGLSRPNRVLAFPGVASVSSPAARIVISEPQRSWTNVVKARLDELARLPVGWDGYAGQPVSFNVANFALQLLNNICLGDEAAPDIVPGNRGDLQIEWHTRSMDVEIHVRGAYRVHAWRRTPDTGDDGEAVDLTTEYTILANWISELAEETLAVDAAAA